MMTGCRTFLYSMLFFLVAGAACAQDKNAMPTGVVTPSSGIVENAALGASFVDTAKPVGRRGSQTMIVEGINDQGWIVGRWTDQAGHSHRFLMNLFLPAFSDIANHGATNVQVWSISDSGQLTIEPDRNGYITCMKLNGGQCGSRAMLEVNADRRAPGFFSPTLCASGCKLAETQATVE